MVAIKLVPDCVMTTGTNSMLRARRKDIGVKPNRILDRTASRGMLYENEELRLRTININADLEKGQQYIKKLRRENNQLRREIWNLRNQYDKLDTMLKNQERDPVSIQELDKSDDEDSFAYGETNTNDEADALSIVEEVDEYDENENLDDNSKDEKKMYYSETTNNSNKLNEDIFVKLFENNVHLGSFIEVITVSTTPTAQKNYVRSMNEFANSSTPAYKMCTFKDQSDTSETSSSHQNCLQDYYTLTFPIDDFENITVQEIIDELERQLMDNCHFIRGVRLTTKNCFITVNTNEQYESLLKTNLKIRGKTIRLEDVCKTSSVLQLSAVPHHISDEQIIAAVSFFADVVSGIERQTYKGLDTGERFMQVKCRDEVPSQVLIGSTYVISRLQKPEPRSNIARRKSFRSQININLKLPNEDQPAKTKEEPSFFSKNTGISSPDLNKKTNVFEFPAATQIQDSQKDTSLERKPMRSPKTTRQETPQLRASQKRGRKPEPQPASPNRPRRASLLRHDFRERSVSDTSSRQSICKRKLSVNGREGSGKIPWCGCWGIGCC